MDKNKYSTIRFILKVAGVALCTLGGVYVVDNVYYNRTHFNTLILFILAVVFCRIFYDLFDPSENRRRMAQVKANQEQIETIKSQLRLIKHYMEEEGMVDEAEINVVASVDRDVRGDKELDEGETEGLQRP